MARLGVGRERENSTHYTQASAAGLGISRQIRYTIFQPSDSNANSIPVWRKGVVHHLRIAADVQQLAEARRFVAAAAAELGAPIETSDELVLAVDEWLSNVIMHGYAGRPGWIELELWAEPAGLGVRVTDAAPPYDPTRRPEPDLTLPLEQRPIGGLGVYLIRRLMDDVTHAVTAAGGNALTLRKKFPPTPQGDAL